MTKRCISFEMMIRSQKALVTDTQDCLLQHPARRCEQQELLRHMDPRKGPESTTASQTGRSDRSGGKEGPKLSKLQYLSSRVDDGQLSRPCCSSERTHRANTMVL